MFAVTSHHFVELLVWYSQFQTSIDSAHGFQSQGGSIIVWALVLPGCNDPQRQFRIPRPGPSPNFRPWYREPTAGVTTQCHFQDGWQIQIHDLAGQSPTLYRLSCPGRRCLIGQTFLLSTETWRHSEGPHEIRVICAQNYFRLQAVLPGAPLIAFRLTGTARSDAFSLMFWLTNPRLNT